MKLYKVETLDGNWELGGTHLLKWSRNQDLITIVSKSQIKKETQLYTIVTECKIADTHLQATDTRKVLGRFEQRK